MRKYTILFCCAIFILVDAETVKTSAGNELGYCSKSTPCGWQIYKPYDRINEYFMKSPCECPEGTKCKEWKDDLSISAYVYRCM